MVLSKNKQKFCAGNWIEHGSLWNTAEYCWFALHFSAMLTTVAFSVKYEHEEMFEHQ